MFHLQNNFPNFVRTRHPCHYAQISRSVFKRAGQGSYLWSPMSGALRGRLDPGAPWNLSSVTGLEPHLGEQHPRCPLWRGSPQPGFSPGARTPSHCFLGLISPTVSFLLFAVGNRPVLMLLPNAQGVRQTEPLHGSVQDLGRCLKSTISLLSEASASLCPPLL